MKAAVRSEALYSILFGHVAVAHVMALGPSDALARYNDCLTSHAVPVVGASLRARFSTESESMTWKPPEIYLLTAARGFGETRISQTTVAPNYAEAVRMRERMRTGPRPYGVPPWEVYWIREAPVAARPRRPRAKPRAKPKPTSSYTFNF